MCSHARFGWRRLRSPAHLEWFHFVTSSRCQGVRDDMPVFRRYLVGKKLLALHRVVHDWFPSLRSLNHHAVNHFLNKNVWSTKETCHITIHDNLLCTLWYLPHCMSWFHNLSVKKNAPSASVAWHALMSSSMFWLCYSYVDFSKFFKMVGFSFNRELKHRRKLHFTAIGGFTDPISFVSCTELLCIARAIQSSPFALANCLVLHQSSNTCTEQCLSSRVRDFHRTICMLQLQDALMKQVSVHSCTST